MGGRTIREMAADLAAGRASSVQLIERCIESAERSNPTLKSFITIAADEARLQAAEADQRRHAKESRGPLDGIPYGAKDVFLTRSIRTTAGSRVLSDWVPDVSATVIRKLRACGAVLLGKTNLHEFAYGATGQNDWAGTVVNPRDPSRLAGGSSSGSAAAVGAGIVPFALGTDTGGSVRVPAALCGVAGFKPTIGRISLEGVIPLCWSLDHGGLLGSRVDDLIAVASSIGLIQDEAREWRSLPCLRVGIVSGWRELSEPAVRRGFDAARIALAQAGATFVEIALPDQVEARAVSLTLQLAEALTYHGPNLRRSRDKFGIDVRSGLVLGQFLSAESYIQCRRLMNCYQAAFERSSAGFDVLLTPACPIVAPLVDSRVAVVGQERMPTGNALTLFTSYFNLVGAPAVVVPAGHDEHGLPVGVQIVGSRNDDALALSVGSELENALRALK